MLKEEDLPDYRLVLGYEMKGGVVHFKISLMKDIMASLSSSACFSV